MGEPGIKLFFQPKYPPADRSTKNYFYLIVLLTNSRMVAMSQSHDKAGQQSSDVRVGEAGVFEVGV